MPLQETDAIVIGSKGWRESSKIITFYTKDYGKVSAVAKGAKRKYKEFGSSLELFSHVYLAYYHREDRTLQIVGNIGSKNSFQEVREDLTKMAHASYIAELVNKSVKGREESKGLFKLLLGILQLIRKGNDPELSTRAFEIKLLRILGYEPHLDACVNCKVKKLTSSERKKSDKVKFSASLGGVLCSACWSADENAITVSLGTISVMKHIKRIALSNLAKLRVTSQQRIELKLLLVDYLVFLLEKELKSLRFLEEVSA